MAGIGMPSGRLARAAGRGWRRLSRGLRVRRASIVFGPRYTMEIPAIPADPKRAEKILAFLAGERVIRRGEVLRPHRAPFRNLLRVHDPLYLERIQTPGAITAMLGTSLDDEASDHFLDVQRAMVGGTSLATALALADGGPTINLGGGLHHAARDRGQGFCAFNDVAVAIAGRRQDGFDAPILVVDLDLHDGDGTRAIFADDPSVFTFSIHNRDLDETEARSSFSLALGSGVEDASYLDALRSHLPAVLEAFRPGLVFYLAGCDPAWDDRIGDWRISHDGLLERDRFVVRSVRAHGAPPLVVLMAGGYGEQAWRPTARFVSWLLAGRALDPPLVAERAIGRFRGVFGLMSEAELSTDPADASWTLSDEDLLPGSRRVRFLDYYSRHGIELALERYGLLDRLRQAGYDGVELDLELDEPSGQTLRLLSDRHPPERLIELKVRRDARSIPDMELLSVEWLMLQDPRAEFSDEHPPLPGQAHPGLGLLRDVSALLVLICERLRLDGLGFVPTHYHVAAQTRGYFRFLDPEQEGWFRALRAALRGLPLAEAARAIEEGRVVDRVSGRVAAWSPGLMVVASSERLRRRLDDPAKLHRARRAERSWSFELRPAAAPLG